MNDDAHNSDDLLQETSLGNSLDVDAEANQRQNITTYQFQPNTRDQLSYKVVQVANVNNSTQGGLNIINASEFQNFLSQQAATGNDSTQVALVGGNFNESDNSTAITTSSQQAAKVPLACFSNTSRNSSISDQESPQSDPSTNPSHFYLLMSPQDVVTNPPGKQQSPMRGPFDVSKIYNAGTVCSRRIQHNEVERRRRDRINTWIMKLSNIVPSCSADQSKQGQSKGGILAKTCDYITDLQQSNKQFENIGKQMERLKFELKVAKMQLKDKQQENEILHQTLRDHGLAVDITSTRATS